MRVELLDAIHAMRALTIPGARGHRRAPSVCRCIASFTRLSALLALVLLCTLPSQARERDAAVIDTIAVNALPREARQTLALIKSGGPFPYPRDGVTFQNRERLLPPRPRNYYREYTVPTPGARNLGARRIVTGQGVEYYYTADHYRSFKRIIEQERTTP